MAADKTEAPTPETLRGWAADPAEGGYCPIHPDTLHALAAELERLRADLALRRLADDERALGLDDWQPVSTVTVQEYDGDPHWPKEGQ